MLYTNLSESLISSFYYVHNALGQGLLELPYHNALFIHLRKKGFNVKYNFPLPVFFECEQVGDYYADLLLENKIIVEIKSVETFSKAHISQVLNYLRISKCRIGFLVNFQHNSCKFRRLVL